MKHIYFLTVLFSLLVCSAKLSAQNTQKVEDPKFQLKFDVRFDAQTTFYGKDDATNQRPDTESGFIGRYLKMVINGKISDKFSYSFRHRLYLDHDNPKSFFSATDWANVSYRPNSKFSVTAGKQMIYIGTIEYDYAPIDVYFASDFWNHVSPFQIGVNVGYAPCKNHQLYAQVTNSPFSTKSLEGIYAYNLMWYGNITNWFSTIYSVNMIEYEKGDFINYIALGNKFKFNRGEIDLDLMNRYAGKGTGFFEDYTISSKFLYNISDKFNIFTKGGYDANKTQDANASFIYDRYVVPGVDLGFYGLGFEFFPIKTDKQALRLHAFWYSSTADPVPHTFNIGIRWQIKALDR